MTRGDDVAGAAGLRALKPSEQREPLVVVMAWPPIRFQNVCGCVGHMLEADVGAEARRPARWRRRRCRTQRRPPSWSRRRRTSRSTDFGTLALPWSSLVCTASSSAALFSTTRAVAPADVTSAARLASATSTTSLPDRASNRLRGEVAAQRDAQRLLRRPCHLLLLEPDLGLLRGQAEVPLQRFVLRCRCPSRRQSPARPLPGRRRSTPDRRRAARRRSSAQGLCASSGFLPRCVCRDPGASRGGWLPGVTERGCRHPGWMTCLKLFAYAASGHRPFGDNSCHCARFD